jgi:parallel beta-helix repeat protein
MFLTRAIPGGISLTDDSGNNIFNNTIHNTTSGIVFKNQKGKNTIYANSIFSNQIILPMPKTIVANSNVTFTNMIKRKRNQIIKYSVTRITITHIFFKYTFFCHLKTKYNRIIQKI